MSPTARRALNWLLTIALATTVAAIASSHSFYASTIVSAFLAPVLVSAAIIYACIRPPLELLQIAGLTVGLWGLEFAFAGARHDVASLLVPTISLFGLGAFLLMGVRAIWARGDEQKTLLYGFVPALIFVASDWFASDLLELTEKLQPKVFDFFLYSYDASLVWMPGPQLGRAFAIHSWFRWLSMFVYIGLPIPIALVYGLKLRKTGAGALPVMYAFLLTGPIGVVFYNLLPAMGPAHVFGAAFPFFMPSHAEAARLVPSLVARPGPRNAIPSLHMAWVLLSWWNSKGLPAAWRAAVLFFVIFTVFATLGTGEHYVVDLIVAYPFALFLQAICKTSLPILDSHRLLPLLFGLGSLLIWFATLALGYRFFWISPAIPWLAAIVSIVSAVALHHWMNATIDALPGKGSALSVAVGE